MKINVVTEKQTENNLEIERKFLVTGPTPELSDGIFVVQTYIFTSKEIELRVRIIENKCTMGIKINLDNFLREEYEYVLPLEEGERLMRLKSDPPPIEKMRYKINYKNMDWEIDFFGGENKGLIIAEIELDYPEQNFEKPPWIGEEVTSDRKYYNADLYKNPYKNWGEIN